jgi:hypothetical protein
MKYINRVTLGVALVIFGIILLYSLTYSPSVPMRPFIIFRTVGGINGWIRRFEIYPNRTYKAYDHDSLIMSGTIYPELAIRLGQLIDNLPYFAYQAEPIFFGYDLMYQTVEVNGTIYDLSKGILSHNYQSILSEIDELYEFN